FSLYTFAKISGFLPPGITGPDASGRISGTPTLPGNFPFVVRVTDSSPTPQSLTQNFSLTVAHPLGRNDSPATASRIVPGGTAATISPYIDPPNGTPAAGDNDYYKVSSLGGVTVHVETLAKRSSSNNPLDTVIEIVDGNGHQLSTCRQPG